jgi:hypothetical protein
MPGGTGSPLFTTAQLGRPPGPRTPAESIQPEPADVADCRQLNLEPDPEGPLRTRYAGIFLFLPLLAQLRFDQLVQSAGYPGSPMVPATSALLSLLALKLLDKERRSHISDFASDTALGMFAGLNILPKRAYAAEYSYRTQRGDQERLLAGWIAALAPRLFPGGRDFSLDFHAIPYRGDPNALETHYVPMRGQAETSVLSFFAQERESGVVCYANANLTRDDQPGEVMRFVTFWHHVTGDDPRWLYFDSKVVPYSELSKINRRGIRFITIRKRGAAVLRRLNGLPADAWQRAVIDTPHRCHRQIRYVSEVIRLRDYPGLIRQIAVAGLGREQPTLFLSNEFDETARSMIIRYAGRNRVEDGLGTSVNFFHLDCLASEVRLNVDLDVALTVLAHGCYRWLAKQLHGFERAAPKGLYRKFVETAGEVRMDSDRVVVRFDRRCHNPILREAKLDKGSHPVAWLEGRPVVFEYA